MRLAVANLACNLSRERIGLVILMRFRESSLHGAHPATGQ
jgi:hypothetical protein